MKEERKERKTLKNLIEEQDLTIEQIAKLTNLGISTIEAYNYGTRQPTLKNALKIAKVLKRSILEIADALGLDTEGIPQLRRRKK